MRSRTYLFAFLAIILAGPLPLGAIQAWAWSSLAAAIGALCLIIAIDQLIRDQPAPVPFRKIIFIAIPYFLVCAWIVVQISPWTPDALHHPAWQSLEAATAQEGTGRITIAPDDSWDELLRLLSYAGAFWIALQLGREGKNAERFLYVFVAGGVAYAIYGLIIHFTGLEMILWFPKDEYIGDITSTFRYKNAYGTYSAFCLVVTLGLMIESLNRATKYQNGPREIRRLTILWLTERGWYFIFAGALLFISLILSNSRGGILAAGLGCLAVLFAFRYALRGKKIPYFTGTMVAVLGILTVLFIAGGGTILDRVGRTDVETERRTDIYEGTIRVIKDSPFLGTGAGSFEQAFNLYPQPKIPVFYRTARAHSTYLEHALELGIPAALVFFLTIGGIGFLLLKGLRRRRRGQAVLAIGIGVFVLSAFHAIIDFTFQVPAIALTFSALIGIACSQSWNTEPSKVSADIPETSG